MSYKMWKNMSYQIWFWTEDFTEGDLLPFLPSFYLSKRNTVYQFLAPETITGVA